MAKNKGCGCFPLLILLGAAGYGGYYWYDKNQQSSEAEAQELSAKEQKTIELRNAEKAAKEAEASAQKAIEEARLAEENANKAKAEAQKLLEEAQQAEAKARTAEADAKKTAEEAAKAAEEAAAKNAEEISQSEPDSATAALDDSTAEQSAESSATETIEPEPEPPNPLYGLSAEQIRELGVDYAEGRNGKSVDEQEAIRLYLRAADMGDIKAQRRMGWRYRQGRGVPKDEQLAYAYFLAAAQQGDQAAADAIGQAPDSRLLAAKIREKGVDYAEGRNGCSINEQEAIRLYIQAADMGDIKAQRWMGWRYRQGRGVPKDEQRAKAYFRAAAQQGDKAAAKALQD